MRASSISSFLAPLRSPSALAVLLIINLAFFMILFRENNNGYSSDGAIEPLTNTNSYSELIEDLRARLEVTEDLLREEKAKSILLLEQQKLLLQKQEDDEEEKEKEERENTAKTSQPLRPKADDSMDRTQQNPKRWLTIGIPTVPRANGIDYLTPTVDAIASQCPTDESDPYYNQFVAVIMNNRPNDHPVFETLKQKYSSASSSSSTTTHNPCLRFVNNPGKHSDPSPNSFDPGSPNVPGSKVRQQSRDVASLLESLSADESHYFLFMEDDFKLCSNGIKALQYMISKAMSFDSNFAAIRCGYGLNGIVLKMEDVPEFARYLLQHLARRPPDHIMVEWFAKETQQSREYLGRRPHFAFRYNIFEHLGTVSTLRPEASIAYPGCYAPLLEPINFEVEAFNPRTCPFEDLWPCNYPGAATQPNDNRLMKFDHAF